MYQNDNFFFFFATSAVDAFKEGGFFKKKDK